MCLAPPRFGQQCGDLIWVGGRCRGVSQTFPPSWEAVGGVGEGVEPGEGPDDGGDLGGADGQQVALLDGCLGAGGQGVLLRSDDFVEDLVGDGRLVGAEAVEGGLVLGDRALVQGEQPAQQWFVGC